MNLSADPILIDLVLSHAKKEELDPKVIWAIIKTESDFNPFATRYEMNYLWTYDITGMAKYIGCTFETMKIGQKTSWGLMQIMGGLAYEKCFRGWPAELCEVNINLKIGCNYLGLAKGKYGPNPLDMYAAYNAGICRKIDGKYVNNDNVNRFKRIYESIDYPQQLLA